MSYVPAADRRQAIVEAAIEVMKEVGFARATTRLIADRAGAPLSAIHYCFATKTELVEAVYLQSQLGMSKALERVRIKNGLQGAIDSIVRVWWSEILDAWPRTQILDEIAVAWSRDGKQELAVRYYDPYVETVESKLNEALIASDEHMAVPTRDLARFLVAGLDGIANEYAARKSKAGCNRLLRLLAAAATALATGAAPLGSESSQVSRAASGRGTRRSA